MERHMKLFPRIWDWLTSRMTRCCKSPDIKRHPTTGRLYCDRCGMHQGEWKETGMNDNAPKDPLKECRDALAIIVAEMRYQGVHSGNELPDDQYVDVQLKAGDIRRDVAAINA